MEGTVVARHLDHLELDYVLSLVGINAKELSLSMKISKAENILKSKDWLSLIRERPFKVNKEFLHRYIKNEHTDIKNSLGGIKSAIESFVGFSDPLFKGISGRIILLSQRVKNFIIEGEPEDVMLQYSQFKYETLAECFELQTKLNKTVRMEPNNNKSIILKEKQQEFYTSFFKENFECIKVLGRGAFGVVLETNHKYDKHQYAVKKVKFPAYKKNQDKAMREVRALVLLQHKNIVRYYCSWVEGKEPLNNVKEEDNDSQLNQPSTTTSPSPPKKKKSTCGSIIVNLQKINIDSNNKVEDQDSIMVFGEMPPPNQENALNVIREPINEPEAKENVLTINRKRRLSQETIERRKTTAKLFYIQMELCKGGNLKQWLKKNKNWDYFSMIEIYLQILDAVAYIHSKELIHRDLKPGNIFFNDNIIKVGDFGLALDVGTRNQTRRNGTGSQRNHTKGVGTKLYMSPELCSGGDYDYKVDVYALGIIFFELLFPLSTEMERDKVLTDLRENDVYPDTFQDDYPEAYILIKNMLEKDPTKRSTVSKIRDKLKDSYENNNHVNNSGYDKNVMVSFAEESFPDDSQRQP